MNEVSRGHEKFLIPERAKTTSLRAVQPSSFPTWISYGERQFFLHDLEASWGRKAIDRFS